MIELLKNEIVVNWIAPIITGLIVVIIPTIFIKVLKLKKDEKIINQANQRFLDSILPFVIQMIDIQTSFISDVRSVIVEESRLKDKYVYSELELRNKLIVDITESEYIDEKRKKELIDFTYSLFGNIKSINKESKEEINNDKKKKPIFFSSIFFMSMILFLISQLMIVLITVFDKSGVKMEDNILLFLPMMLGAISLMVLFLSFIIKLLDSNITRKNNNRIIVGDYIFNGSEAYNRMHRIIINRDKNGQKKIVK